MENRKDKLFFILLTVILALLAVFSVVIFIYSCYDANKNNNVFGVTFELIYIPLFFIVQFFAALMSMKAVQRGSFIFSELTHVRDNPKLRSRPAAIIALVFATLNLALFTYSLLVVLKVVPGISIFPLTLYLAALPTSITILVVAVFFYIYPFLFLNKGEK